MSLYIFIEKSTLSVKVPVGYENFFMMLFCKFFLSKLDKYFFYFIKKLPVFVFAKTPIFPRISRSFC